MVEAQPANLNIVNEEMIIQTKWIRKGEELDIRVSKSNVTSFERFLECAHDQLQRLKKEDIERTGGLYEVFDVMRNHVDDKVANEALTHLEEKYGIRFKVYVFTANDLTGVPSKLLE